MGPLIFKLAMSAYLISGLAILLLSCRKIRVAARTWPVALYAGFLLHTIELIRRFVVSGRTPIATPHESFSFFCWCLMAFFLVSLRRYKASFLGVILVPFSCLLMLFSSFWDDGIGPPVPVLQSTWLPVHGVISFLGEAVLGMAFAAGIMYVVQETRIKGKRIKVGASSLPSLETLDEINYFSLRLGFPLLTAGIVSGCLWASNAWGSWWSWDPKEVWSLVTWLIYAALLHQRINVGWRGRRPAVMAVVGFCCVMFTFIGVNLLLPGQHSYTHLER